MKGVDDGASTLMKHASTALVLVLLACTGRGAPAARRPIVLVPIGPVAPELLVHLQKEVRGILQRPVTIGAEIPRPAAAFDAKRQQYRGSALLEELERHDRGDAERIVGILDADAYAPNLNFIFGQARKPGRVAVVALARLHDSFRGRPDDPVSVRDRAVKVTIHELGHSFGFEHCDNSRCVMFFANSFRDIDQSGFRYDRERPPD